MATFYNSSAREVGDVDEVTVVTSTSDSTIVLSILVANVNGSSNSDVTCSHEDGSSTLQNYVGFTVTVPSDSSLDLLSNKYILPSGHSLSFLSSVSGALDVAVSYVEV